MSDGERELPQARNSRGRNTHIRTSKVDLRELRAGIVEVYGEKMGDWSNRQASDQ